MENQDFKIPIRIEHQNQLVLTTEQLAEFYGCKVIQIQQNFNKNSDKFVEGKHYYIISGDEIKNLRLDNIEVQISPMTRTLYLWTKRGAARHAKMLTTDRAWEVFEILLLHL